MSDTLLAPEIETVTTDGNNGDHDKFAHYVDKDDMLMSLMNGTPAKALCGKEWVVTRDGQKFPVCPDCKKAYEGLPHD